MLGGGGTLATVGALVVIAVTTGYRMAKNATARYPGHADPSFYYTVARNLRAGRGPTVDYVWQFLSPEPHLHHYAFDYWLPLPSLLMAVGLHLGAGLPAALDVNAALIALTAVGTLLVARSLTGSASVGAAAGAVTVLLPAMSNFAVRAEAAAALAACVLLCMAAALGARTRPWLWPVAGVLAGLAAIARNEGLLLVGVLLVSVLAWNHGRTALVRLATTGAGVLVALGPVLVVNQHLFGSPVTPASRTFPFITSYPQLYSLHVDQSPHVLVAHGWRHFVGVRTDAAQDQFRLAHAVVGARLLTTLAVILALGLLAAVLRRRPRPGLDTLRSPWLLPLGYGVVELAFEAVVTPVVASAGAFQKSMVSVAPVFVIAALAAGRALPVGRAARTLGVLALVAATATTVADHTRTAILINDDAGLVAARSAPALAAEARCLGRRPVVLTRDPWELTEATGYRTVQIPIARWPRVLAVIRRYGVTDYTGLHPLGGRTLADLARPGGPLVRVGGSAAAPLYRIRATTGHHHCPAAAARSVRR